MILITGHGDVPMALEAIREGAYDFIEKPAAPEHLIDVVQRALEKRFLVLENRALRRELDSISGMDRRIVRALAGYRKGPPDDRQYRRHGGRRAHRGGNRDRQGTGGPLPA